jgi:hypothetical protein
MWSFILFELNSSLSYLFFGSERGLMPKKKTKELHEYFEACKPPETSTKKRFETSFGGVSIT